MRSYFKGSFRDGSGNPILSGVVSVYLAGGTTAASVYVSLASTTAVNSVTGSSTDGTFEFWTDWADYDEGQRFKIVLSQAGYTSQTWDNVGVEVVLGTYAIAADKTVTTKWEIPYGVVFAIATGVTLTVNGACRIGRYPVFSCAGTGKVVFGTGAVDDILLEWFYGGVSASAALNTAAFTLAAGSMTNPVIQFLAGTYSHAGLEFKPVAQYTNIIVMKGKGRGITTLKNTAAATIGVDLANADWSQIYDMTIDQNAMVEDALYLDSCTYANVARLHIKGVPATSEKRALYAEACHGMSGKDIFFADDNSNQLWLYNVNGPTFDGLNFGSAGTSANSNQMYLSEVIGGTFNQMTVDDGGTWGVIYVGACQGTVFNGLYTETTADLLDDAVKIVNSYNITFNGGRMFNRTNDGYAMFLIDGSYGVDINNFRFNRDTNDTNPFIVFGNNPANISIRNITSRNVVSSTDATAVATAGVYCGVAATQKVTNLIVDNWTDILGTTTHTIYATRAELKNIDGNVTIYGSSTSPIQLQNIGGTVTDGSYKASKINGGFVSVWNEVASPAAGELTLPDGDVFYITGTNNITSIAAASSTISRKVTLIFAGILTITDGSNLKMNGNFTTSADDTIGLVCDGTNWYESPPRSAN